MVTHCSLYSLALCSMLTEEHDVISECVDREKKRSTTCRLQIQSLKSQSWINAMHKMTMMMPSRSLTRMRLPLCLGTPVPWFSVATVEQHVTTGIGNFPFVHNTDNYFLLWGDMEMRKGRAKWDRTSANCARPLELTRHVPFAKPSKNWHNWSTTWRGSRRNSCSDQKNSLLPWRSGTRSRRGSVFLRKQL